MSISFSAVYGFKRKFGRILAASGKDRAIRLNKILTGRKPVKILYRFYPLRVFCAAGTRPVER
jgi:hypothetical protein